MKKFLLLFTLITSMLFVGCDNIMPTFNEKTMETCKISSKEVLTADESIKLLKEGNIRFLNDKSIVTNVSSERRNSLRNSQSPYAVVVSCSDSRVTPELIFNVGLGEIFDIRLAGNVVNSDALGSIEYAVSYLNSPLILLIGHENCGAVEAAYNNVNHDMKFQGNINSIIKKIKPSVKETKSLDEAIHKNVENVALEIKNSPIIKKLVEENKVAVKTAYYSLDGRVVIND